MDFVRMQKGEKMSRLIDADAFIRRLRESSEGEDEATREYVNEIHDLLEIEATFYPVDAEPTRLGKWIKVGDNTYRCSRCNEVSCCNGNFCTDCGARMDAE